MKKFALFSAVIIATVYTGQAYAAPPATGVVNVRTKTTLSGAIGCSNSGQTITFSGTTEGSAIPGFGARFQQSNNDNKTFTTVGSVSVDIGNLSNTSFKKQGKVTGITGNPYIWIAPVRVNNGVETVDEAEATYIGRCVDPQLRFSPPPIFGYIQLILAASATGAECSNKGSTLSYGASNNGTNNTKVAFFFQNKSMDITTFRNGIKSGDIKATVSFAFDGTQGLTNGFAKSSTGGNPYVAYDIIDCTPYESASQSNDAGKACLAKAELCNFSNVNDGGVCNTKNYYKNNTSTEFYKHSDTANGGRTWLEQNYNPNMSALVPSTPTRCNQLN